MPMEEVIKKELSVVFVSEWVAKRVSKRMPRLNQRETVPQWYLNTSKFIPKND